MKIYEVKHTILREWFDNKAAALAAVKATETETTGGPIAQMVTHEIESGRKGLVKFLNETAGALSSILDDDDDNDAAALLEASGHIIARVAASTAVNRVPPASYYPER